MIINENSSLARYDSLVLSREKRAVMEKANKCHRLLGISGFTGFSLGTISEITAVMVDYTRAVDAGTAAPLTLTIIGVVLQVLGIAAVIMSQCWTMQNYQHFQMDT